MRVRTLTSVATLAAAAALVATALVPSAHALSTNGEFDYAEALQDSMLFYGIQRSGQLPPDNPVDWRGDSDLSDGSDHGVNLTGGYHDAGDLVKFGLPEAYSMTMLAWGLADYGQGYAAAGQTQAALSNLRWGDDYILSAFTAPTTFYGQVGDANSDHSYWGPAETNPNTRPSSAVTASCTGADLAGQAASALAASAVVFKTADAKYSARLTAQAQALWNFANSYRGSYSSCITGAQGYYSSYSGYWDELVQGAIWLYRATGTASWLTTAETDYANLPLASQSSLHEYNWTISWDDVSYADYILLAQITGQSQYIADAERFLDWWTTGVNGSKVSYSPGGEAFLNQWGSLRYSANTAFAALEFGDYLTTLGTDATRAATYHAFAVGQINYALGDNPNHESYEVGFTNAGKNTAWPRNPHHSTAHDPWSNNLNTPAQTRHLAYGLLVGGPTGANDAFSDDRTQYQYTEGALDYNALFSGALARLSQEYGGAPAAAFPKAELPDGPQQYVQAAINNQGSNFIEIKALINNQSAWPARPMPNASFRYYFTLDAGQAASQVTLSSSYNQCQAPSAPTQYSGSTYYIAVSCSNLNLEPDGEANYPNIDYQAQVQFRLTFPAAHNPAGDWSFQGIPTTANAAPVTVADIPLYSGNTLVWGSPPSSTTRPGVPGALTASAVTATGATLSWTASAPGGNPLAGYNVYTSAGTLLATVAASTTSYSVIGLNSNRTAPYGYFVTAVDSQGLASAASNTAQFITNSANTSLAAAASTAPSMPGTLLASAVSGSGATLSWSASTAGTNPVSAYQVYQLSPTPRLVATTAATATSYTLTGLAPATAYGYEVAALDSAGRISPVLEAAAFTTLASGASSSPTPSVSASASASASPSPSPSASASPSSSPSSSPSPSASASGGAGGCVATYALTNSWGGGFQASVTIANHGAAAINGWTIKWTFPGDQKITQLWNAGYTQTGAQVTATSLSYNSTIAPGSSVNFGFTGTFTSNDTSPTAFTVNGAGCP
jgi:endoglucanase